MEDSSALQSADPNPLPCCLLAGLCILAIGFIVWDRRDDFRSMYVIVMMSRADRDRLMRIGGGRVKLEPEGSPVPEIKIDFDDLTPRFDFQFSPPVSRRGSRTQEIFWTKLEHEGDLV